ncbi:MAG: dihydroneopterin aldolase [Leptonema sp. (in: bacteria)]
MKIFIYDLKIIMNIGIREDERANPQEIIINLECEVDFSKAMESDNIHDTLNYKDILRVIQNYCYNNSPKLLEKLGGDLIIEIRKHFPTIKKIKIQIIKPAAIPSSKGAGVEISREF